MALSNAERQRQYRQRLKRRAAAASEELGELNRHYAQGRVEERKRILPLLRKKATELSPEMAARWAFIEKGLLAIDGHPTLEQWKLSARELGQRNEELLLAQLFRECMTDHSRTDSAQQSRDISPSASSPAPAPPADEEEKLRDAQMRQAERMKKILRPGE